MTHPVNRREFLHATTSAAAVAALAVGRAGAGTNNIPVAKLSKLGVPVFNAPGANANAVKELVIAGLLMAARKLPQALEFRDSELIEEVLRARREGTTAGVLRSL